MKSSVARIQPLVDNHKTQLQSHKNVLISIKRQSKNHSDYRILKKALENFVPSESIYFKQYSLISEINKNYELIITDSKNIHRIFSESTAFKIMIEESFYSTDDIPDLDVLDFYYDPIKNTIHIRRDNLKSFSFINEILSHVFLPFTIKLSYNKNIDRQKIPTILKKMSQLFPFANIFKADESNTDGNLRISIEKSIKNIDFEKSILTFNDEVLIKKLKTNFTYPIKEIGANTINFLWEICGQLENLGLISFYSNKETLVNAYQEIIWTEQKTQDQH